jgi:hemolysin activation/secretion protein
MMKKILLGHWFMGLAVVAHAQAVPDAGSINQQIQRSDGQPIPDPTIASPTEKGSAAPPADLPSNVQVQVQRFVFVGNTLLDTAALDQAVAGYTGRTLGLRQLQEASSAVAALYRQSGWVVRAFLPRQDVTQCTVTIQVVEANYQGLKFENELEARVSQAQIQRIFDAQQAVGAKLNANKLERAQLLASDLAGVGVETVMREGSSENTTQVLAKVSNEPKVAGSVRWDNAGSVATGTSQISTTGELRSPVGFGDSLRWNAMLSEGINYASVAYAVPVGSDGLRIGVNGTNLNYKVISPELVGLKSVGSSDFSGVNVNYPLVRTRQGNVHLSMDYEHKKFENRANSAVITQYKITNWSAGVTADLSDKWGGGGFSTASLNWVNGNLDLGGSPNAGLDATSSRTAGDFSKLRYSLSRQQTLGPNVVGVLSFSGQTASKNLDSSEKMYLGGPDTVRAFPPAEAGGSEGSLANAELRWSLGAGVTVSALYDWGHVRLNRYNNFVGAPKANEFVYEGYGLGLTWQPNANTVVKATWATRGAPNPNKSASGKDQDGTLVTDRLWVNATYFFDTGL